MGEKNKPSEEVIETYEDLTNVKERINPKNKINRNEIEKNITEVNNMEGVQVVETDMEIPDLWDNRKKQLERKLGREITDKKDLFSEIIKDEAADNIENMSHIVKISNEKAIKIIQSDEEVGNMADDNVREGNERKTGELSEVAFSQLAYYVNNKTNNFNIQKLNNKNNIFVGDYYINGYITEVKAAKTTSKGQNIVHRCHSHETSAEMYFKNGVLPECYALMYVCNLTAFGAGVIVGIQGLTPVLPQYNGLYSKNTKILQNGWSYFSVVDKDTLEWYELSDKGFHEIKNKLEKIKI